MAAVVVACSSCAILLLAGASSCRHMSWVVLPPNLKTRVASFNHMSTTFTQTSARAVQARLSTFLFLFVRLSPFFLLLSGYPLSLMPWSVSLFDRLVFGLPKKNRQSRMLHRWATETLTISQVWSKTRRLSKETETKNKTRQNDNKSNPNPNPKPNPNTSRIDPRKKKPGSSPKSHTIPALNIGSNFWTFRFEWPGIS